MLLELEPHIIVGNDMLYAYNVITDSGRLTSSWGRDQILIPCNVLRSLKDNGTKPSEESAAHYVEIGLTKG